MRKLVFTFFFFLCIAATKAQDTAVAFAKYTLTHVMDTTQPENPIVRNNILYLGANNTSSYGTDRAAQISSLGSQVMIRGDIAVQSVPIGAASSGLPKGFSLLGNQIKDLGKNKMSTISIAGQQVYAVEENIPTIEWNIMQDTKEIMGIPCQKAVGDFKGRTYEAWFSSQLPYSNGPWKLGGLPGLILEASDTKKEVVFKLVTFEKMNGPQVSLAVPTDVLKVSPKEYKEYQDAIQRDRDASVGSTRGAGVVSDQVRIVTGGVMRGTVGPDGKAVKPRMMNNPLEKEPVKK